MSSRRRPGSHGTPVGFCRRGRDQVGGWEGGEGRSVRNGFNADMELRRKELKEGLEGED